MRTPLALGLVLAGALLGAGCGDDAARVGGPDAVAVRVRGMAIDMAAQAPVVILEEVDGDRQLPIWIGLAEARSILAGLHDEPAPRPNTHDLAKRLIDDLEAHLRYVVVTSLEDGVYYADVVLRVDGRELHVDARPSDAIALAVRAHAPLFVRDAVFDAQAEGAEEPEGRRIHGGDDPRPAPGRQLPVRSL